MRGELWTVETEPNVRKVMLQDRVAKRQVPVGTATLTEVGTWTYSGGPVRMDAHFETLYGLLEGLALIVGETGISETEVGR